MYCIHIHIYGMIFTHNKSTLYIHTKYSSNKFMQAFRGDKRRRPPQHFRLALRYIHAIYPYNIFIQFIHITYSINAIIHVIIHTSLARRQTSSSSPALPLGAPLYSCMDDHVHMVIHVINAIDSYKPCAETSVVVLPSTSAWRSAIFM